MAETPDSCHTEKEAQSSSKPLSPPLKIEPASEWANSTFTALESSNHALLPTSPALTLPGSYPYSPTTLEPGPTFEEIKDTARQYIHAAGQFVPSHEDVRKIAHNASNTVREYFPNNISTRLGPVNPTQEAIPTSPLEESETSPSSGGGFVLINRGNKTTKDETQSVSESQPTSVKEPAQVPSELSGAPRAKLLILEPKRGKNDASSLQTDQASENASLRALPGSKAESIRKHDSIPTPYSYTAKYAISRSSSNSGVYTSNGHTDQRNSDINEEVNTQGLNGEGSVTAQKAEVVSAASPGPENGMLATIEDEGSEEEPGPIQTNVSARNVGKMEKGNRQEEQGLEDARIKDDEQTKPQVEGITVEGKLGEERLSDTRKQSAEKRTPRRTDDLSPQLESNTPIERGGPSTANAEHERATNTSESTGSPLPKTRQRQKDASANEDPRLQPPVTSANNLRVARAMSEPTVKQAVGASTSGADDVIPSKRQGENGRKKGSFIQRLKTWSKKLSQNKKGQKQTARV